MALRFKPMPGLTFVTIICVGILISLGTWQYHRLQWKTALLAEVEAAVNAPPLTSFIDIQKAIENDEPVDFRRYASNAQSVAISQSFMVFTAMNKNISWRVFSPVSNGDVTAFAGLDIVSDEMKSKLKGTANNDIALIGYVRRARVKARGMVKSSPEENRWFGFNPMPDSHDWAVMSGIDADMSFYIDVIPEALDAHALPTKRPDIRNNHFDYMLTWYSFAIILLIIYTIMHYRNGRLSWS